MGPESAPSIEVRLLPADTATVADAPFEVVERKGAGHPDTLCDGVAEAMAIALGRHYRRVCGALLHFNLDKVMLAAGQVERGFGHGRVLRPMTVYVGDRATGTLAGRSLEIEELLMGTACDWFLRTLPHLDPGEGRPNIVPVLAAGSAELAGLFERSRPIGANDTSAAVGYAPLSPVEAATLGLERWLNGPEFKARFPATGQDVKIMAVRRGQHAEFTVAMPFLARLVPDVAAWRRLHRSVVEGTVEGARRLLPQAMDVAVRLNALDDPSRGSEGLYLTVTGTSAEHGDSGEVGRGNRVNGLIPLMRPGATEAAAGKNPRCHVGKIYNLLAFDLAREIHAEVAGLRSVTVWLVSCIGEPLDRPRLAALELIPARGADGARLERQASERVRARLERLPEFCAELEQGLHPVC